MTHHFCFAVAALVALGGCGPTNECRSSPTVDRNMIVTEARFAEWIEARRDAGCEDADSPVPPAAHLLEWKLPSSLPLASAQAMRDRAYAFCARIRPRDGNCPRSQDEALNTIKDAYTVAEGYRAHRGDLDYLKGGLHPPVAWDIVQDTSVLDRAEATCRSVYLDNGSADLRTLAYCMATAVGHSPFASIAN